MVISRINFGLDLGFWMFSDMETDIENKLI